MPGVLHEFNSMSKKTVALRGKVSLPSDMVDTLLYIEKNTDATISQIIENALIHFKLPQKYQALKKELASSDSDS